MIGIVFKVMWQPDDAGARSPPVMKYPSQTTAKCSERLTPWSPDQPL